MRKPVATCHFVAEDNFLNVAELQKEPSDVWDLPPVTVTTRTTTCLVINPYNTSFVTVTGWKVVPNNVTSRYVSLDSFLVIVIQFVLAKELAISLGFGV